MKPSAARSVWIDSELPMSSDFCRMSYALYRTDGDMGRVVAARVPDRSLLGVGDYIQDSLELSDEAMAYMTGHTHPSAPLFVMTKAGVGLLSDRYHLSAGLGVYLHIHAHPEATARLINSGVLGYGDGVEFLVSQRIRERGDKVTAKDARAYPALLEAWQAVRNTPTSLFGTDGRGSLTVADLRLGIRKLALFAGCDLTFTLRKPDPSTSFSPNVRVKCYRPIMLEGLLFFLLSEMREYSATRGGVCRLEIPSEPGREGLSLMLRYPVSAETETPDEQLLDAYHSHLTYVGGLGGLDAYFPPEPLPPRRAGDLPERAVMLEWIFDPSLRSTSDLKAHLRILYGDEHRAIPMDGEVPLP